MNCERPFGDKIRPVEIGSFNHVNRENSLAMGCVNHASIIKSLDIEPVNHHDHSLRLACNFKGSLLVLATKLTRAEMKYRNGKTLKSDPFPPSTSLSPPPPPHVEIFKANGWFESKIVANGFHFMKRKRRGSNDDDDDDENIKRSKTREESKMDIDRLNATTTTAQIANRNRGAGNQSVIDIELCKNSDAATNRKEIVRRIERLLENINRIKSAKNERKTEVPRFAAKKCDSSLDLWSVLSCTRAPYGDDFYRTVESAKRAVAAATTSSSSSHQKKSDEFSWKLRKRDLRIVEDMAVDFVVRNKTNDIETRLASARRKLARETTQDGATSSGAGAKNQKMKFGGVGDGKEDKQQTLFNGRIRTTTTTIKRKFPCEHCSYETDNKSHLLRHQSSIHDTFKPYRCYICVKEFSRVEYIKQHMQVSHPGVAYDSSRAKNEEAVRDQLARITNNDVTRRVVAAAAAVVKEDDQTINDSNETTTKNGRYIEKKNKNKDILSNSSSPKNELRCSFCDFTSVESQIFERHVGTCRPPSSEKLPCRICRKTFPGRAPLQIHSATSHFALLYCCPFCTFYTWSPSTYDWHVLRAHSSSSKSVMATPSPSRSASAKSFKMHQRDPHCWSLV